MCPRAVAWTSDVTYVCTVGLTGLIATEEEVIPSLPLSSRCEPDLFITLPTSAILVDSTRNVLNCPLSQERNECLCTTRPTGGERGVASLAVLVSRVSNITLRGRA